MKIDRVCGVYFSPARKTRAVVLDTAARLSGLFGAELELIDITRPAARERAYGFSAGDLVVFGMPTYAGKLPNKLLPFVKEGFRGNGALAVALVTFGGRAFDNALAELCACLEAGGFHTVGAGAFVCPHAFSETLSAGRPDEADRAELRRFAEAVAARVDALREPPAPVAVPGDAAAPYYVPRGLDGEPKSFLKAKPKTDPARCVRCGACAALCPMGSIDAREPAEAAGLCIKCHACVRLCPRGAKYFDDPAFLSHRAMLERDFQRRAENRWFT